MHGIDPTCGCIHSIIDTMLFRFSRLFRQVYVEITSLCMYSFWFRLVKWFVNCGQKIPVQRLLPRRRFQQSEVIQIAFFAVLVHHYISRVLTKRKIVFRKGLVSRRPSLKMNSKIILSRFFNKSFNNESTNTSPVHYDEYKHVAYFICV